MRALISPFGVLLLFAIAIGALAAGPLLMPEGYSWISNTTSESAAQGVEGAWLARLGFLMFGLAVLRLAAMRSAIWPPGATWLHGSFGVLMIAAAAFSHKPWVAGVPFDPIEDFLHSVAATAMGFSFAFGVLIRLVKRSMQDKLGRWLDIIALLASIAIPSLMAIQAGVAGLVQRLMFLIALVWYGKEALTPGLNGEERMGKRESFSG